jgi:hypothetical protein
VCLECGVGEELGLVVGVTCHQPFGDGWGVAAAQFMEGVGLVSKLRCLNRLDLVCDSFRWNRGHVGSRLMIFGCQAVEHQFGDICLV